MFQISIIEGLWSSLRESIIIPPSTVKDIYFIESAVGFAQAVEWNEPFILGLICFHLCFYLLIYVSRNHTWLEKTLFAMIGDWSLINCSSFNIYSGWRFNPLLLNYV